MATLGESSAKRGSDKMSPSRRPFLRRIGSPRALTGISLADINVLDHRFQHRLFASPDDLVESIRRHGQRVPVVLTGDAPSYTVVDGFRRIGALSALGQDEVLASFEKADSEQELFAISFEANAHRRNLTPLDRAHAIWHACERFRLGKAEVASMLGLSVRQVERYLGLLEFPDPIREALRERRISMAHAVVLHRKECQDPEAWVHEVQKSQLSASGLAERLARPKRAGATTPLRKDAAGFRLASIRYRHSMSDAQKRRIWDSLEGAMRIIAQSLTRS